MTRILPSIPESLSTKLPVSGLLNLRHRTQKMSLGSYARKSVFDLVHDIPGSLGWLRDLSLVATQTAKKQLPQNHVVGEHIIVDSVDQTASGQHTLIHLVFNCACPRSTGHRIVS